MAGRGSIASSGALYAENLGLRLGSKVVFHGVNLALPECGVVSLVGPSGSGKSALCRLLSGRAFSGEARPWGVLSYGRVDWRLCPRAALVDCEQDVVSGDVLGFLVGGMSSAEFLDVSTGEARGAASRWAGLLLRGLGLGWVRLGAELASLTVGQRRLLALALASASDCSLVCVDRASDGLPESERGALLELVRVIARTKAVLFVPSSLGEARELGGDVAVLAGGGLREQTPVKEFFESPGSTWGGRLLAGEAGADEPDERAPPAGLVSSHAAGWVLPGVLMGMSRPGLVRDLAEDLDRLERLGVSVVVGLEEQPHHGQEIEARGIEYIHFPIEDMRAPAPLDALRAGELICARMERGEAVALHCRGGQGRTGTMLAVCLVLRGHSALQAVELLRQLFPRYIETEAQLALVSSLVASLVPPVSLRALSSFGLSVEQIAASDVDALPFGVIRLDRRGRVVAYNAYESELARCPKEEVIGKSFFSQVAPCTQVKRFYGRFLDGVARGALDTSFLFYFPFVHGARLVRISMLHRASDDSYWVLVRG